MRLIVLLSTEIFLYVAVLFQQPATDNSLLIATVVSGAVVSIATLIITTWGQIRTSEIKARLEKQGEKIEKQAETTEVIHSLVNNQHALDLAAIARLQGMVDLLLGSQSDKQKSDQSLAAFQAGQAHAVMGSTLPAIAALEPAKVEVINPEPLPVDVVNKQEKK